MKKLLCFIFAAALFAVYFTQGTAVYAADKLCISQIAVESGNDAAEKLENGGYTVIYQNLNPSGGDRIYFGYKLGTKSITGLAVSSELKKSVSIDSVIYSPVSSLNLNQGTKGSPVYLYGTTDSKAGGGIVSLNFVRDSRDGSVNLLDKCGDGSVIVRTEDGRAADFDEGIEKRDLYLFMIKENSCKPYISEIKTVNVSSEESAFKKIAASGCDYFISEPVAKSGGVSTYLCTDRTADASQAVRFAAVSDSAEIDGITYTSAGSFNLNGESVNLYYTKDKTVGNPVSEITKGSLTTAEFTLGDWAKSYFSRPESSAVSSICGEDLYNSLIESEDEYTQLKIKNDCGASDTGLYMILSANGLSLDKTEESVAALVSEQRQENTEMQRDTEITGIEKEEPTAEPDRSENAVNAYGSAISGGSLIAIAVMAIIAVIAALIFVMVKEKKNGKND